MNIQIKEGKYLEELTSKRILIEEIVAGIARGRNSALKSSNRYTPLNGIGTRTYELIVEELSPGLEKLGFRRNDHGSQVRFECENELFTFPIRLLCCKGKRGNSSNQLRVNKKGGFTRQLVAENYPFRPQLPLINIEEIDGYLEEKKFMNCWISWDFAGIGNDQCITLYLALPEEMDASGSTLCCAELEVIYKGEAFETINIVIERPEGAVITPSLEEM